MNSFKSLAVAAVLLNLLTACSEVPSNSTVESLIKEHYKQADTMTAEARTSAKNNENHKSSNNGIKSAMPTLDSVDNINCEIDERDYTYLCTADITQTMNGHTSINQGSFRLYKADNEWVLDL